jgi:hypothetical protein
MQEVLSGLITLRKEFRKAILEKAHKSNRTVASFVEHSLQSKKVNFEFNYRKLQKSNVDEELIILWDTYIELGETILNFVERNEI